MAECCISGAESIQTGPLCCHLILWVAVDCQPAKITGSICAIYVNACVSKAIELERHWKFRSGWQETCYEAQLGRAHIIATP
jgi:hypothetical protein